MIIALILAQDKKTIKESYHEKINIPEPNIHRPGLSYESAPRKERLHVYLQDADLLFLCAVVPQSL